MDRIDRIINHPIFLENLRKNQEAEKDRCFCHHDITHFLDVARIGLIISLEEELNIERELIYGAALLHDIGRHVQYAQGTPHEQASAIIAPDILRDCGFDDNETDVIITAILYHRNEDTARESSLRGVLYRADKASRSCYICSVERECSWMEDKKNKNICY
ncbi:MAG: HD domain-containing protein [Acetatifactor sp.]|nr:HD domain-containing protein [Acetatifactor sp.]